MCRREGGVEFDELDEAALLDGEGVPKAQIATLLGISRTTVVKAVASQALPKHERPSVATSLTPFEPAVRQLLATTPDMAATVIAERVGWVGSSSWDCCTDR